MSKDAKAVAELKPSATCLLIRKSLYFKVLGNFQSYGYIMFNIGSQKQRQPYRCEQPSIGKAGASNLSYVPSWAAHAGQQSDDTISRIFFTLGLSWNFFNAFLAVVFADCTIYLRLEFESLAIWVLEQMYMRGIPIKLHLFCQGISKYSNYIGYHFTSCGEASGYTYIRSLGNCRFTDSRFYSLRRNDGVESFGQLSYFYNCFSVYRGRLSGRWIQVLPRI